MTSADIISKVQTLWFTNDFCRTSILAYPVSEQSKCQRNKEISEDDLKRFEDEIQKLTDDHVKKIDEIISHKEKEIMEV